MLVFVKTEETTSTIVSNVFGTVDVLVNCAGLYFSDDVLRFDRSKWDPMIQLNLTAAFEMSHEASKVMILQKSGKIINICSLFSFLGGQQSPANVAAKHGLVGLTKAYCDELAGYNIQVNGIAPGYLTTDMMKNDREDPEINQQILAHVPANYWGSPADLMGALVYLASSASNFVNGHILPVDGGYLVR